MAEGRRPGGLTALAICNFVFGGLGAFGILALAALLGLADEATKAKMMESLEKIPNVAMLYVGVVIAIVTVGLMIVSGVGYLRQKRVLGRSLGNAYAICSLGNTLFSLIVIGQKFGITTIINFVYPVLTLVLLNSTFKDDLVN